MSPCSSAAMRPAGFIGLGGMGLPMALRLREAGQPLVVWNRSAGKCAPLHAAGAQVATSAGAVFDAADVVILMLATTDACNAVLARATPVFAARVRGRTIIHMGTTAPADSRALAADIAAAGGHYIECPVSGSPQRAQAGQLVGMLAGPAAALEQLRPLLSPLCKQIVFCGDVPSALTMKLAVNLYLITSVTGLCEAFHFASVHGLDLHRFQAILEAGPMASTVSTAKLRKLLGTDDSVDASIQDVLKNNRLIAAAGRQAALSSPLLDASHRLFEEALQAGLGALDMAAVLQAIAARTASLPGRGQDAAPPAPSGS